MSEKDTNALEIKDHFIPDTLNVGNLGLARLCIEVRSAFSFPRRRKGGEEEEECCSTHPTMLLTRVDFARPTGQCHVRVLVGCLSLVPVFSSVAAHFNDDSGSRDCNTPLGCVYMRGCTSV